jgi:hypothetical protein
VKKLLLNKNFTFIGNRDIIPFNGIEDRDT